MKKNQLVRKVQHVVAKRRIPTNHERIKNHVDKKYGKSVFDRKYNLGKKIDYYA